MKISKERDSRRAQVSQQSRSLGLGQPSTHGFEYRKPTMWQRVRTFVRNAVMEPTYIIPFLLVVFTVLFVRAYYVPSGSMIPTLVEGDRIFSIARYFPTGQTYKEGDIVTFLSPSDDTIYVKRVVANGGDTVEIYGDTLYVNGQESPYQGSGTGNVNGTWHLAQDEYFCMGDNRSNSADSRYIGPIKANRMVSKVLCVYFPFSDAKLV